MRAGYAAVGHTVLWLYLTVAYCAWFLTCYNILLWLCLNVAHCSWFLTRYNTLYFGYALL